MNTASLIPLTVFPLKDGEVVKIPSAPSNLLWIDFETTGLDSEKDHILQAAVVITNRDASDCASGFWTPIDHQTDGVLDDLYWWTKENLPASIMEDCRTHPNRMSPQALDESIVTMLKCYGFVASYERGISSTAGPRLGPMLAGNSVWFDRGFVKKFLPRTYACLHYRQVDVTSVETFLNAAFPRYAQELTFKKQRKHDAPADIRESIEQYRFFMEVLKRATVQEFSIENSVAISNMSRAIHAEINKE